MFSVPKGIQAILKFSFDKHGVANRLYTVSEVRTSGRRAASERVVCCTIRLNTQLAKMSFPKWISQLSCRVLYDYSTKPLQTIVHCSFFA